ncbi:MAG: ABC transporter substrate-binding protein [Treponema sp.]|nr:ABC transporter substrate-binding protein [Treponema sp.]
MRNTKKLSILLFLSLAVTVAFSLGNSKNSKKKADSDVRIVTLGPAATEIVFAIGAQDQLVARTDLCDYPAQAANYPSVGGFAGNTISLEAIISYEPTLVYLFAGMHDYLVQPLKDAGIEVYVSNAVSIDAVKQEVLDIGKLTGHDKEAQKVVKQMNATLTRTQKYIKSKSKGKNAPKVYWEVWNDPMMSAGKNSFMNDIIQKAGGNNIFGNLAEAYPMVSEEAVLLADPDYIFYSGDGMGGGKPSDIFEPKGGVHYMGDDDRFVRSTPRCVEAVEKLAKILWP